MIGAAVRPYLLAGGVALFAAWSTGLYIKGRADGAHVAEKKAIELTFQQMKERGLINEAVRNTDAVDLCIELGGLPNECAN